MSGEMLFYDTLSGHYFTSSMDRIYFAQNKINREALFSPVRERYFDLLNKLRIDLGLPELDESFVYFCDKPDGSLLDVKFGLALSVNNQLTTIIDFNIHKTKHKVSVRKKRSV